MNLCLTKQRLFSYLVSEIYDASYNPAHWQKVLELIRRMTGSSAITLLYRDHGAVKACLAFNVGWSDQVLREYNEHWGAKDPMFELNQRLVPTGVAKACHQLVPDRQQLEAMAPDFYDWFKKSGGYYVAGATLFNENDRQAAIAVQRGREKGKWSKRRMELLTELVPHLQRALKIHREFSRLKIQETALQIGLDKMVMGLALFDEQGQVMYTNPMAETILSSHPAIQRQGDRIIATHPEDGRKLKMLLDHAIQDMLSETFQPQAAGLRSGNGRGPLPVLVTSVKPDDKMADPEAGRIRAAIYFGDPTHSHPILPETLTETYGLTSAEAWVAISIANGLSLEDVAEQSGTSINTARSQLRSIFRKTNTSRQAELVKLLLTGPFSIAS